MNSMELAEDQREPESEQKEEHRAPQAQSESKDSKSSNSSSKPKMANVSRRRNHSEESAPQIAVVPGGQPHPMYRHPGPWQPVVMVQPQQGGFMQQPPHWGIFRSPPTEAAWTKQPYQQDGSKSPSKNSKRKSPHKKTVPPPSNKKSSSSSDSRNRHQQTKWQPVMMSGGPQQLIMAGPSGSGQPMMLVVPPTMNGDQVMPGQGDQRMLVPQHMMPATGQEMWAPSHPMVPNVTCQSVGSFVKKKVGNKKENGQEKLDSSSEDKFMNGHSKQKSSIQNRDKGRGNYRCGRCGAPKKGHVCPYQPKLKRSSNDPPPVMRNASAQVEMDEFMVLRRLNLEIQGLPESYMTQPHCQADMVGAESYEYISEEISPNYKKHIEKEDKAV